MPVGIQQHLDVIICKDAAEATEKGHVYTDRGVVPVTIQHVVVIRDGTELHNPTVDFLMVDQEGNEFVFMITGALLKSIPC